jgi:hypothetical protein
MRIQELPDWLETYRPDDKIYADSYEGTAPELRALLKTAIAFAFHRWDMHDGEQLLEHLCQRKGFQYREKIRPTSWVLAIIGSGFSSPARFLAHLIPAVLAGAEHIIIVSEQPFSPALVTAMELAGLEDSFLLNACNTERLYKELCTICSDGRILIFPSITGEISPIQKQLMHEAEAKSIPLLHDRYAPEILSLYPKDLEKEKLRLIRWLHPDAILHTSHNFSTTSPVQVILSPKLISDADTPFVAGPGMEACWPGPSPEFFRSHFCSAFLLQESSL